MALACEVCGHRTAINHIIPIRADRKTVSMQKIVFLLLLSTVNITIETSPETIRAMI